MELSSLRDTWQALETRGQLTLVGSALLVVATMVVLFTYASRTSYVTLMSGVEPAQSAEVTQALESAGIAYRLGAGGSEISVPEDDTATARIALAKQGLPSDAHVGFELFDEKKLGATEFQQRVDYERALEGEVARTVEGIDGVRRAQVQLVLPDKRLFADDAEQPTAAVLLDAGGALDATIVRGIAHLVSSSVEGLEPSQVTVADESGTLLWPEGQAAGSGVSARLQAEQRYAAQLSAQANSMLVATLGPDKAQARVRAELQLDEKTIDKVTYAKKGTPLEVSLDEETLDSSGAAGTTGSSSTGAKVPAYAGAAQGGGGSKYSKTADRTSFGVDKTVERTTVVPGKVERIDVALLVDESVPKNQVDAIAQAVSSIAGVQLKRGDTLAVSRVRFTEPPAAEQGPAGGAAGLLSDPLRLARTAGLVLGIAGFLFFVRRALRRREHDPVLEPTWLREIEQTLPLASLEAPSSPVRPALDPAAEAREALRGEVEQIARTQPEQIAAQVSTWMKD